MTKKYVFDEDDIKEAIKKVYLDESKWYIYNIKQIETESYYGGKYKTVIVEAIEQD